MSEWSHRQLVRASDAADVIVKRDLCFRSEVVLPCTTTMAVGAEGDEAYMELAS